MKRHFSDGHVAVLRVAVLFWLSMTVLLFTGCTKHGNDATDKVSKTATDPVANSGTQTKSQPEREPDSPNPAGNDAQSENSENHESLRASGKSGQDQVEETPLNNGSSTDEPLSAVEIIDRIDDGVVLITTQNALGTVTGTGSGFVIDDTGLIATNYHVMTNAVSAYVQFRDGRKADVVGVRAFDPEHDLAILRVDVPAEKLEAFALRNPEKLPQGMGLIAIGHPSGFKFTVSQGIVSAVRKTEDLPEEYQTFLSSAPDTVWVQTDAPFSSGSSGGPLLDHKGNLIAISTWIAEGQNLGFAVHVQHLIELRSRLDDKATPLPLPGLGIIISPRVAAIVNEFNQEFQHYSRECQQARQQVSEEEWLKVFVENNPRPVYGRKLLDLARKSSVAATTVEALFAACLAATDRSAASMSVVEESIDLLLEKFLQEERIADVCLALTEVAHPRVVEFLRQVIDQTPHRTVRGVACFCLESVLEAENEGGEKYDPDRLALLERIEEEFADVWIRGQRLGPLIEEELFALRYLSVGRKAPNIVGQDVHGERFELEEYLGKVTLIDFSADWCPHCRQMYPHETAMAEKFKDQPFALLGVSTDEKVTLQRLMEQKTITWKNWHDGPKGEIAKQWQVTAFPMFYVLNKQGRIQFRKNTGGNEEELEDAVRDLLADSSLRLTGDIIPLGSEWKFLEDGSDQGTMWREREFDDSRWKRGAAPIGFGWDDEATKLRQSKMTTVYFRREFTIPSELQLEDLVLEVFVDDGFAVYVNGTEVVRDNLSADAKFDTTAAFASSQNGLRARYHPIDPATLLEGTNVISVEVHQHHPASADLRFGVSLSSNVIPLLRKELSREDSIAHRRSLQILTQLGSTASEALPEIRKIFETGDSSLQIDALLTLTCIRPTLAKSLKLPAPSSPVEDQLRYGWAMYIHDKIWNVIQTRSLSPRNYEVARRHLLAAKIMDPQIPNFKMLMAMIEIRLGNYKEAMESLRARSFFRFSYTPYELASLSICHSKLGDQQQARIALNELTKEIQKPKWAWVLELRELAREAKELLPAEAKRPVEAIKPE